MRPALASPRAYEEDWLRRASIRAYAVLRERDPARQQALVATDALELLSADSLQRFELAVEGGPGGERYGAALPEVAEQMQGALLPAALRAGKSLISNHPQLDPELANLAARCRNARVTTHLLLVRAHGETHGAYAVHWLGRERPSFEARSGFYHYWDTIGMAVAATNEFARLQAEMDELREYAFYDSLTGLPNGQALERELAANAGVELFSVLALDFDGMREANTALGYTAGGNVLIRTVGQGLEQLSRPGEFAARMHNAGDEFALLLPGVDEPSAAARAADVEAALDGLTVPETHRGIYRGASVGHATRRPDETPGQALGRAIAQMQARKLARKSRVADGVACADEGPERRS